MPKSRPPQVEEFRRRMVALVRVARTSEELSREFEPCGETIRNGIRQADLADGRRHDALTSEEKEGTAPSPPGEPSAPCRARYLEKTLE